MCRTMQKISNGDVYKHNIFDRFLIVDNIDFDRKIFYYRVTDDLGGLVSACQSKAVDFLSEIKNHWAIHE